jgi:hypothetical protein
MFCATLGTLPFGDRPRGIVTRRRSTDEMRCPSREIKFQQRCIAVGNKRIALTVTALLSMAASAKKGASFKTARFPICGGRLLRAN